MKQSRIAVVDQGSTATKGALVAGDGRPRRLRSRPVRRSHDRGRVTHDPSEIAKGVLELLDELLAEGEVSAIGLTCQRSTCLIWDRRTGRPLTPALSWQDTAEADRIARLEDAGGEISRSTGLRASAHYAAPKLAALLEQLPEGAARAEGGELVAGTLDAFLMRQLTGRESTEPGHAGRTLLYHLEKGRWDEALCARFGVPSAALPEVLPSAAPRGAYRGVPVTAAAGDQQAALLGHGGWRPGVAAAHFGTGAFVLTSTGAQVRRHPELLSAVLASLPHSRRFQIEGSVNSAGSAVDWAVKLAGGTIQEWADRPLEPERYPMILPAFAGAAAPWWRPQARAVAAGLTLAHGGEELVGGVLCGVAMRVLDCVEAMAETGQPIERLRVSGKLTRLRGLVGLLADAGGLPVEVAAEEESGLAGIARLAAAGGDGDASALDAPAPVGRRREPRWSPQRAAGARAAWREFARAALELP